MIKSWVWSYFKKLNNGSALGSAECHVDKCGKVLKPGGTTTSLASHLNSQHKIFEKKRKPEGSLSTENTQQSKKQKSITDYLGKYKTLEETIARRLLVFVLRKDFHTKKLQRVTFSNAL